MSTWRDDLQTEITQLENELREFRIHLEHAIPDIVLYNYVLDVLEHCNAVHSLTQNPNLGRAAHACTRAAFESCFDALLLVSDPSEYDRNGSLARACELLEHEDLRERRTKGLLAIGKTPLPPGKTPEELINADARAWDKDSPGKGAVLRDAFSDAKDQKKWLRHWSGFSRKKIAEVVSAAFWEDPSVADMADFVYGLLSIHSHPRPRTGSRITNVDEEGRLTYAPDPQDAEMSPAIAQIACRLARAAIAMRAEMFE